MKAGLTFAAGMVCGIVLTIAGVSLRRDSQGAVLFAPGGRDDRGAGAGASAVTLVPGNGAAVVPLPKVRTLEENIAIVKKAIESGLALPMDGESSSYYESLSEWAAKDPKGALAYISGAARFPDRLEAIATALTQLGRRDPAAAARWLQEKMDTADRAEASARVLWSLSEEFPRQALQLAGAAGLKNEALGNALAVLAKEDPGTAIQYFERMAGSERPAAAMRMTEIWGQEDFAGALRWCATQQDTGHFSEALEGLLTACLGSHVDQLAELLLRFPEAARHVRSEALRGLLDRDLEEGVRALALLPSEKTSEALEWWAHRALARDPERVMTVLRDSLPEEKRSQVMKGAFPGWLASDRRAALAWLGAQPEGALKQILQESVDQNLAESDPAGALRRLALRAPGEDVTAATEAAVRSLANTDPVAAAEWARTNWSRATPGTVQAIVDQYFAVDDEAAAIWLTGLPPGEGRDVAAARAAVLWMDRGETELATQTVGSIGNQARKLAAMFALYSGLKGRDQAAALRWLEVQPLTDDVKENWRAIAGGP